MRIAWLLVQVRVTFLQAAVPASIVLRWNLLMEIRDIGKLLVHSSSPCSTDGGKDFLKETTPPQTNSITPDVCVLSCERAAARRSDEIHA